MVAAPLNVQRWKIVHHPGVWDPRSAEEKATQVLHHEAIHLMHRIVAGSKQEIIDTVLLNMVRLEERIA